MQKNKRLERIISTHSKIRQRFPLLEKDLFSNKRTYLNCGAGTITVDMAVKAMEDAARTSNPMPGEIYPAEIATKDLHWEVRSIAADFLNADSPDEISFHLSTTNALFNLAFSFQQHISKKQNLIVTDLDHMANVSPWERIFGGEIGCEVRRARIDEKYRLDIDHLLSLVDENTGIIALTMAANAFGSIVPLKKIIAAVREKSPDCVVCVDAVHHALHSPIDVQDIDCDFLAISGYKIFGPMLVIRWGKKKWMDKLSPYRVETAKDISPTKFEQGMLNNAALAAFKAALDYLLWLEKEVIDPQEKLNLDRRTCFSKVMQTVEEYGALLTRRILQGVQHLDPSRIRFFGITDLERTKERDPTFAFEIEGISAADVKKQLWLESGIQIADGNHYSAAVYRVLKRPSLCRASFCHYDTLETADFFLKALEELICI